MSTVPNETVSTDEPLSNLLFDYRGADIILRSQDCYHFRIPKTIIIDNSPVFDELIQRTLDSPRNSDAEESLPVIQLPEHGEIFRYLLTFIYPVPPLLPSTSDEIMELLSVAQKYRMEIALTHIRGSIALQSSLPTGLEATFYSYALAQKYGLQALQTARAILLKQSFVFLEYFYNKFDIMSGASLYELWMYREGVQAFLTSDLMEFAASGARGTISGLRCTELSSSQIPGWLNSYITAMGQYPTLFNSAEFNVILACHIMEKARAHGCECASIPSKTIHEFWEALASVVNRSFKKAESALSLVGEREDPEAQINLTTPSLEPFDVPDANFIIRSSDNVNFRVHKSILALASPFFKDLLSLPQPSDGEIVDGLPVVRLSESSKLLNSLVTMLYPVPPVLVEIIRGKVKLGELPAPKQAEAFPAYAIASANGFILEMEYAARLTLDCQFTFESIGEELRLFEGWALRDLANFRKRCRDSLVASFDSFLDVQPSGPSSIWVGCPEVLFLGASGQLQSRQARSLPRWLNQLLSRIQNELKLQTFARPLDIHSRIRQEYTTAFQSHMARSFCSGVNRTNGLTFCAELENKLAQTRNEVSVRPLDETSVEVQAAGIVQVAIYWWQSCVHCWTS